MKSEIKIPDHILYPQGAVFMIYRVLYNFKHSRMGFQNSITECALSEEHAIQNAKNSVSGCYGSKMLPRFTFQIDRSFAPQKPKA